MDSKTRSGEKREISSVLKKILEHDVKLTKSFVSFLLNFVTIRSLKTHCKFLEISCHGIVWITGWIALSWLIDSKSLYEMQINMIFGLLLDIIFVALIKAATRRRRPSVNDDIFSIGPDKFSFPSGHASRAFFVVCFFTLLEPTPLYFWPPLFAWATSVALSRLLMAKHHILDVCAGIVLGTLESALLSLIWLGPDASRWLMTWITEDHVPGGIEST